MDPGATTVLVTGASSGIGAATAIAFARSGASRVQLVARTRSKLEAVAEQVRSAGAEARVCACDVGVAESVDSLSQELADEPPDIVINNAGVGRWLAVEETAPAELDEMTSVPYRAGFLITRAFLPGMLARRRGHVLFVNSPACMIGIPGAAGYSAARWAVRGLAEVMRNDLGGSGVGVTHFVVGKVSSAYFDHNPGAEDRIPGISSMIPTLTPEETARRIVRAVSRGRAQVVTPFMLWSFYQMNQVAPWAVRALVRSSGWSR